MSLFSFFSRQCLAATLLPSPALTLSLSLPLSFSLVACKVHFSLSAFAVFICTLYLFCCCLPFFFSFFNLANSCCCCCGCCCCCWSYHYTPTLFHILSGLLWSSQRRKAKLTACLRLRCRRRRRRRRQFPLCPLASSMWEMGFMTLLKTEKACNKDMQIQQQQQLHKQC